jgi:uracil-DNA glycosylase family 4
LSGAWITAPVRCAPPHNKPTPDERDACRDWFAADVELVPWRVAVCLGAYGYQSLASLVGLRPRPRFAHGAEATVEWQGAARRVLCTYHVSQQNTFTGRLTPAMLDEVLTRAAAL